MTHPAKTLFVPAAQAGRVRVEPHIVTSAGVIASYRAQATFPLDRYHRRGQITPRQFHAGMRLYEAWAVGICGAHDPEAATGARQPAGYADARLDAATDYRRAVQYLGQRLSPVVTGVCCDDLTVEQLARDWGMDRKGLMWGLRTALDVLADFYKMPDDG